jgi:anhydro-N-acetylmuramic acid kinase
MGLMSGTSMDGIDAALITTDGCRIISVGPAATYPYPQDFREELRGVLGRRPGPDDAPLIRELTLAHVDAVSRLLRAGGLRRSAVDLIGFHGHTVMHRPDLRVTCQIGDGQLLSDLTGTTVVGDFRARDVREGGNGAPLVPVFHAALARDLPRPLCVLNIGGVANVTWIGSGDEPEVLAFDTGPGNALIDDWVRRATGRRWDERGRLARGGRPDQALVDVWLAAPFFQEPPPKSLDRDAFAARLREITHFSPEDGAATLTAFTAQAIAASLPFFPAPPRRWLVSGGGRHNNALMAMIGAVLPTPVVPIDAEGWDGDALEAEAFGFLAVRTLHGMPISLPSTTGVRMPMIGGHVFRPASRERPTGTVQQQL